LVNIKYDNLKLKDWIEKKLLKRPKSKIINPKNKDYNWNTDGKKRDKLVFLGVGERKKEKTRQQQTASPLLTRVILGEREHDSAAKDTVKNLVWLLGGTTRPT
jgi:hypothetical protein